MICVVIKGPTFQDAHQQITNALDYADLVELRLDCFISLDLNALKRLRSHFSIPMIFTLRSQKQGGSYSQSEDHRLTDIRSIASLKPEFLDLENHVSLNFIEEISSHHPDIKLILSYHNFEETPENLEEIYHEMQNIPVFYYKIAVASKNCIDALRFLCWAKKKESNLIAISLGPHGQVSRILGPVNGSPITYTSLDDDQKSAPGQLSAITLIDRFRYRSLTPRTALYGLIGDPVDHSISDETHNALMGAACLDALYVKIQVKPSEISEFLQLAKTLRFRGLSVTMPLKEHILPFLDHIDCHARDIGAVNTLVFRDDKIHGFNTDSIGALNAIEREFLVKGKRIVIIGAGGAAKAIAYEALQRGGLVTIINRDAKKAIQIAQSLHCIGKGLDHMASCAEQGYDILINCTPAPMPIACEYILPQAIVMDIKTKPKETAFLMHAREKGCRIIHGYQMFVEQALGQYDHWFEDRFSISDYRKVLEKKALDCIL